MSAFLVSFGCALALALSLVSIAAQTSYPPEQIHIAIGWTPDRMAFNWLTFDYPVQTWSFAVVDTLPTLDSPNVITQSGSEYLFVDPWDRSEINRTIHLVIVKRLQPSTTYYYKVGDDKYGYSDVYSFRTGVNAVTVSDAANVPQKYVIYGDLGVWQLSTVVESVTQEIDADPHNVDTVIHVGDLAYDLYKQDGTLGDEFMNMVQPIASRVPYMVCPGNHEKYANFSHYSQRYRGQPSHTGTVWTESGETPNNWYYSWNEGLVHWVAISTEIYFRFPFMIGEQFEWLVSDLQIANTNRTLAPWVVVYGHKQMYCSDDYSDCAPGGSAETLREGVWNDNENRREYGLEDLWHEFGVDFYFAGHQHNYERMYDVFKHHTTQTTYNMPATTYLLVGAAGAEHGLNRFKPEQPQWSAVRLLAYGYSHFYVWNATHIQFEYVIADNDLKVLNVGRNHHDVYETVWYVQEQHGPFLAPKDEKERESEKENRMFVFDMSVVESRITNSTKSETVNLYTQCGLAFPEIHFVEDEKIQYISDDKEDYRGIHGVFF